MNLILKSSINKKRKEFDATSIGRTIPKGILETGAETTFDKEYTNLDVATEAPK